MKAPLILLLLLSASYASLLWQYSTEGPVSAKPLVYQGVIVVASDDGIVYGLDPGTGQRKWQTQVGRTPNEIVSADNAVYVSTTKGKVLKLGANGAKQWEVNLNSTAYNISYVYGLAVNQKYVFVTSNAGVFELDKNGSVRSRLATFNDSILSAPVAGTDYVVYGKGRELIRQSENGPVQWRATLSEGSFWLSRPIIDGNVVYIGALDDRMHAYIVTTGAEVWDARTRNWVLSTPAASGGVVYFGSNDGMVYAVDSADGNSRWVAPTQLAVQSQPESGMIGGLEAIFVGSTDKSMYAISKESGEIVWKGTTAGSVGSPLFYQNKVIFGSDDGKISAYSTERACSIMNPHEADVIGLKELVVSGRYVSEAGGAQVLVSVNGGEWTGANVSEDRSWTLTLNPKASLGGGLNTISCQVADSGGSESGEAFTTVSINHDPNVPLSNFVVTVTPNIIEGKNFTVYVNDGDDGSPVDRFGLSLPDRIYTADRNITLMIPEAGSYKATIRKIGFNDKTITIDVNTSGVNPLYIAVGVLLIIIIVWQVWTRFLSQRFAKKKK